MHKYDAILVLGTSIDKKLFAPRVEKAVQIYKAGLANKIIFSGRYWGGLNKKPKRTEANVMAEYALALGVPKKDVLKEEKSLNTIGNFYFTKTLVLKPLKVRKLIVVAHAAHMVKVKYLTKKILGPSYICKFVLDKKDDEEGLAHKGAGDIKGFFKDIKDGDGAKVLKLLRGHPYYKRYSL